MQDGSAEATVARAGDSKMLRERRLYKLQMWMIVRRHLGWQGGSSEGRQWGALWET